MSTSTPKTVGRKKSASILHIPEAITQIKLIFEETPIISNSEALKVRFEPLSKLNGKSFNVIKKELSQKGIISFSRSKPSGYSLDWGILQDQIDKLNLSNSMGKIRMNYTVPVQTPQNPPQLEKNPAKIRKKIPRIKKDLPKSKASPTKSKARPTKSKASPTKLKASPMKSKKPSASRKKQDLLLDDRFIGALRKLFTKKGTIANAEDLLSEFKVIPLPSKWTPNTVKNDLSRKKVLLYSRSKPKGFRLDYAMLEKLLTENQNIAELDEKIKTLKKKQKIHKKTNVSVQYSTEDILERIPSFPKYLMKRISKDAQKSIKMGLLEINNLSQAKLDNVIDHLSQSRMFFSADYDKENQILVYIEEKLKFLHRRSEELHDKEGDIMMHKLIVVPIKKGKFSKIIKNWGPKYGVEDCAWEIVNKLGRKAKKIPFNEYALRKKIVMKLEELYPEKKK